MKIRNVMQYHPPIFDYTQWYYYPPSTQTMYAAYVNRHKPVTLPEYNPLLITNRLYRAIRKNVPRGVSPMTVEDYIQSFSQPSKRKMYQRVYDDYVGHGFIRFYVQPFTKIEKVSSSKYKAPRLIQARHPTFNLQFGPYIKALERAAFKNHHRSYNFGVGTYEQIAARIVKMSRRFSWYTGLDHTEWDAHVTVAMIEENIKADFAACMHDKNLLQLDKRTLYSKCRSRAGDVFDTSGSQQSGCPSTKYRNSMTNLGILRLALEDYNNEVAPIRGDAVVCGDDAILFTDTSPNIVAFARILRRYNQITKLEKPTQCIHEVEFCNTKLVYRDDGIPTMMFNPSRLNRKFGMTNLQGLNYKKFLYEVAVCNAYMHHRNPIGVCWAKSFDIDVSRPLPDLIYLDSWKIDQYHQQSVFTKPSGITQSMYRAWPDLDMELDLTRAIARRCKSRRFKIVERTLQVYASHEQKTLAISTGLC